MLLLYCIVSLLLPAGYGLPGGPPIASFRDRICDQLLPNHGTNTPRAGNGDYFILSNLINNGGAYTAGQSYSLQLLGATNRFRGFLIQAREGTNYIGSFTNLPALTQTLGCDASNPAATVTHMNPSRVDFTALNFTWQAPSDSDGTITFMYTVVQAFTTFYTALDAAQERPPFSVTPAGLPTTAPTPMNFVPPATPNVPPEAYRLKTRIPDGCTPTVDCSYFLGIRTNTNSSFLDIYLEGESQGWVAVGFTDTPNMFKSANLHLFGGCNKDGDHSRAYMYLFNGDGDSGYSMAIEGFSSDVMGCNRKEGTDEVFVEDTWNVPSPMRFNELDPNQDGVYTHSTEFSNGNISCNFSRFIGVVNPGYDLNLNGEHYLLFGRGDSGGGNKSFPFHSPTIPTISTSRVNPVTAVGKVGVDTVSARLIRAHGILMIIAYPILAMTAIFFAAWMKPALPNGEWFQVHRAFLTASLFIAALAFVLIFLAFRDNSTPGLITLGSSNGIGTAHFVIGIIVMALHILNPIIAAFRCKPDDKNRWIFKLVHGSIIGQVVQSLALTSVGLGLFRFSTVYSRFVNLTIFWVYLAFNASFLVLVVVNVVVFYCLPYFTANKDDERAPILVSASPPEEKIKIELSPRKKSAINQPPPPKTKDVLLRWISLGVFLAVLLPCMIAIVVLVALPQR